MTCYQSTFIIHVTFFHLFSFSTLFWCRCTCEQPSWAAAPSSGPPSCASHGIVVTAPPAWLWPSSWTPVRLWRRCERPGWPEKSEGSRGKTEGRRTLLLSFGPLSFSRTDFCLTCNHILNAPWRVEEYVTGWKHALTHTHTTEMDFKGWCNNTMNTIGLKVADMLTLSSE